MPFLYTDEENRSASRSSNMSILWRRTGGSTLWKNRFPWMSFPTYLAGWLLFTYSLSDQQAGFSRIFGKAADLHIADISQEICRDFPSLRGRRFRELRDNSRYARYAAEPDNGRAFLYLFSGLMLKRYSREFDPFNKALDLVALGTLADLMPLTDENRILVKKGMTALIRPARPGLRELFIRQRILGPYPGDLGCLLADFSLD